MPVSWIHKMNESNSRLHKEATIEKVVKDVKNDKIRGEFVVIVKRP